MERLNAGERRRPASPEEERRCLRCGFPVPDRPRGCRGGRCGNCGHPYPLGDCAD